MMELIQRECLRYNSRSCNILRSVETALYLLKETVLKYPLEKECVMRWAELTDLYSNEISYGMKFHGQFSIHNLQGNILCHKAI